MQALQRWRWRRLCQRYRLRRVTASGQLRERPAPVVELSEHHIESAEAGVSWVSQQIQALGQPGDVAIVFGATLSEQDSQDPSCSRSTTGESDLAGPPRTGHQHRRGRRAGRNPRHPECNAGRVLGETD